MLHLGGPIGNQWWRRKTFPLSLANAHLFAAQGRVGRMADTL